MHQEVFATDGSLVDLFMMNKNLEVCSSSPTTELNGQTNEHQGFEVSDTKILSINKGLLAAYYAGKVIIAGFNGNLRDFTEAAKLGRGFFIITEFAKINSILLPFRSVCSLEVGFQNLTVINSLVYHYLRISLIRN